MPAPPIIYINLDKDAERRERMEQQLLATGLPFKRFPAVLWNELDKAKKNQFYSPALNDKKYFKTLSNGEKGCYASHLFAWQQLLASDAPYLTVLEDDVQILPNFAATLAAVTTLSEGSWDMIKLIGRKEEQIATEHVLIKDQLSFITYRRVPSSTGGYIISRSGAQKLLASRVPFGRPIDVDLRFWFENNLNMFGAYPAQIAWAETSLQSSIDTPGNTDALRYSDHTFSKRLKKVGMNLQLALGNAWAQRHAPRASDLFQPKTGT